MRVFSIFMVMLLLLGVLVAPTHAQAPPTDSVTLTEGFVNTQLQANLGPNLTNLYVDMQPGQLVLGAVTAGRNPLDISITLVPSVVDGRLDFEATSFSINDFEIDLTQLGSNPGGDAAVGGLEDVVRGSTQGNPIESVVVTESAMTLSWTRANPNDPAWQLVDTALSLTLTESYVNDLPGFSDPADPNLLNVSVDFQPGQLVLTSTRRYPDGSEVPTAVTMVPTLNNGIITWTVTAVVVDGGATDAMDIARMNDNLTASWRAYFSGVYQSGNLSNIVITDSLLTLTWDASLGGGDDMLDGGGTLIISEAEINQTYRVTNPANITITDVYVDLQPGQVVTSATLNLASGSVVEEVVVFVPQINDGVVWWLVSSVTLGGEPVSQDVLDGLNDALTSYWMDAVWRYTSTYAVSSVTITDDQIEVRTTLR